MKMIKIEVISDNEIITSGLYGHSFMIPRVGEYIECMNNKYLINSITHEFLGEGSVLQTSRIKIYVTEV